MFKAIKEFLLGKEEVVAVPQATIVPSNPPVLTPPSVVVTSAKPAVAKKPAVKKPTVKKATTRKPKAK